MGEEVVFLFEIKRLFHGDSIASSKKKKKKKKETRKGSLSLVRALAALVWGRKVKKGKSKDASGVGREIGGKRVCEVYPMSEPLGEEESISSEVT